MFQSVCLFAMAARNCLLGILLLLIAMSSRTTAVTFTQGRAQPPFSALGTGDYVWKPEVSPTGPVVIIVSGSRPACGPTARLSGSHGCVRLLTDFAEKLYTVTQKGTTVIVADDRFAPREMVHLACFFLRVLDSTLTADGYAWRPELASTGPVTIIVSASNSMAFVYRNGVEIGSASVTLPEGEHIEIQVITAFDKTDADGHRKSLAVAPLGGGKKVDVPELARRSSIPAGFLQKAREVVTAGTTLILSDLAVSPTQSKPAFNILNASVAPSGTGH